MHTCYSLCTNEVLNLGLANLNNPTRLLLSLANQMVSLAEQMGKRGEVDVLEVYSQPQGNKLAIGPPLSIIGGTRQVWSHRVPALMHGPVASF